MSNDNAGKSAETRLVLICDDEVHIRAVLERRFAAKGWRVLTAADGVELVETARRERPHVIVSDHQMPEMTGAEASRKLSEDPETAGIPILLLSGRGHLIDADMIAGTAVYTTLPKPFSA
ncbi:MAG: response regulator, partial [Planctomycetota bacterium]